jgi:hypothetical protein
MESKDIDDYPGGGIEVTEVPVEDPLVTATTITVSAIAASPSLPVRRATRRRSPVDPRRSSAL